MRRVLLVGIFLLALIFRFWDLAKTPEAIDEDEMALGYYAYSLWQNGTDEYGNRLPIYFESVGDYKYGLYSYFSALPVAVMGLNPFSTRFIAALSGSLSVLMIYFLTLKISGKQKIALISAAVLAVSPTQIHFSRVAYNNILGALFAMGSLFYYLKWSETGKRKDLILLILSFLISIFSYQAYRVFLPLSVFGLTILNLFKSGVKGKIKLIVVTIILVVLVIFSFIPKESRARAQSANALINQPKINEQLTEDYVAKTNIPLSRTFHNKLTSLTLGFVDRYLSYFDPKFLFLETNASGERHSIPGMGLLYLIELPLFLIGIIASLTRVNKNRYIPILLLLSSVVAGSMVLDSRSTTRSVVMVYATSIISAYGINTLLNLKKYRKLVIVLITFFYFVSVVYFFHQYFIHKKYHNPWYGDVGLMEMVNLVNKYQDNYDKVVISKGHYMPFLFYNRINPKDFIATAVVNDRNKTTGVRVSGYQKLIFNMPYDCPIVGKKKILYVCFGYKIPKNAIVLDIVRYRDGFPAITLIEFKPLITGVKPAILPERLEYFDKTDIRFSDGLLPANYEYYWPI